MNVISIFFRSILKRLREDEEMVSYYEYSDGYIYGIPNNFYMTKDVETYGESGRSLLPTGAALARKDYLDAYHAYRREADPDFDEAEVATPQGMLDFLLWVKETYHLSNSNPTVNISAFERIERTEASGCAGSWSIFPCRKRTRTASTSISRRRTNLSR